MEKGIPNQTNYISECYPSIPLGVNSVTRYQKEMHEALNRRKRSLNMQNQNSMSASKSFEQKNTARQHKSHRHKIIDDKRNIRINLFERYNKEHERDHDEKGRNHHHHHHHRKHHSHYKQNKHSKVTF